LTVPFFAFPEDVRRIICTTNAIEALKAQLRRAVRAEGHFPNDGKTEKANRTDPCWPVERDKAPLLDLEQA
jgi:transposase-like protein